MNTLFILFSTGAWISGSLILRSKNPVHAVFYLVLVFLHASGLLCLLGLEYFALLQLLVYVGALAIMFLFVVMLLDIPATEIVAYKKGTYPATFILLFFLVFGIWLALTQSDSEIGLFSNVYLFDWASLEKETSIIDQLGIALYGVHADLLIVASLILLVAMIGAVGLTLKRRVRAPIHDIFAQHNRDFMSVIIKK
jgi:NADH-quinone oxidoreductase subunit J